MIDFYWAKSQYVWVKGYWCK
ncbi:hypothetical protein [Nostoc sp.]